MKTLVSILLAAVLAIFVPSQASAQEAGYAIHCDFKSGKLVQCATAPIGTIRQVRLGSWSLGDFDVSGLIALQSNTSLGIGVTKSWALAENLRLAIGPSVRSAQDPGSDEVRLRFGAVASLSWRF